jgi:hypothetical protein
VDELMAFSAKRNQVGFCVVTEGAATSYVVNIEVPRSSTLLATPTITL